ncbi:hypothetical protein IQ268_08420, partial [Oculatella sp. LEGE 06141]|uniref:hypothetical protein n=1 Tax=Oculatella sp. LEGE 06141 TaxID=1828648 RepID=UPI0019E187E5
PDPLLPQRQLEEIAERGWVVATSQLQAVLGVAPKEGDRYGFQLQRCGRIGREAGWQILKNPRV